MRRDYEEIRYGGFVNRKWLLFNDRSVNRLICGDVRVVGQKNFTAVCLGIDVYEKNPFVLLGQAGCEGYA